MTDRNDDRVLRHTNKAVADTLDRVLEWGKRHSREADACRERNNITLCSFYMGKAEAYQQACNHIANELGF